MIAALILAACNRDGTQSGPILPRVRDLPAYDPTPFDDGKIVCYMSTGGRINLTAAYSPGVYRRVAQYLDGELALEERESTHFFKWETFSFKSNAILLPSIRALDCKARHLDELYALVPDGEIDPGEEPAYPSPEWDLWADPVSGPVTLERWRFSPGKGWPTIDEDTSAVKPLGTPSGRARLSAVFMDGERLGAADRRALKFEREPLVHLDVDARALVPDPDGRFVLVFTRDEGILRIDLAHPEATPVSLAPPPSPGFEYGVCEDDGLGNPAPVLADNAWGERVLVLSDTRRGLWILADEDNDGDFDRRAHIGPILTATASLGLVDRQGELSWE